MGLGRSEASVLRQLAEAGAAREEFALCFGSVEGRGALVLGGGADAYTSSTRVEQERMLWTPMLTMPRTPYYFTIEIESMGVGGHDLKVDKSVYAAGYGAVVDSGTTFGYLPSAAYSAFVEAVVVAAKSKGLNLTDGPDPSFRDTCFEGAPEYTDKEGLAKVFPTMDLTLAGDVRLSLGPLNYLFVHTFGKGKYCLGIFDNGASGALLESRRAW